MRIRHGGWRLTTSGYVHFTRRNDVSMGIAPLWRRTGTGPTLTQTGSAKSIMNGDMRREGVEASVGGSR